MKVALVNPPTDDAIQTELPWYIARGAGVFPPLGLMYLASYLRRRHSGCEVVILDSVAEGRKTAQILHALAAFGPDLVGITAHTHNLVDVIALVRGIKKINPGIHVTLGGPHPTIFPQISVALEGVDTVVIGEGEAIFADLVACLARGGDPKTVGGMFFKQGATVTYTGPAAAPQDLDALPFPERRGLKLSRYRYAVNAAGGPMTTMVSSRGCEGRCIFCSTPRAAFRKRSPANIADEMEACVKSGIREIHFVDDTFNTDPGHAIAVCDEIRRRALPVRWGIRARADKLTKKLLGRLKESGCHRVNIGAETASDEGLKMLCKGTTLGQVKDAFSWARDAGLTTVAYFMLGCPHEKTRGHVEKTIDFAIALDPDYAMFNILTPYPGTPLYENGVKAGVVAKNTWESFARDPRKDFRIPYWEEWLKREELEGLLSRAYRRFYLRPRFIFRTLKKTRRPGAFVKRAGVGMHILKGAH